jgi:hypothetical protein
MIRLRGVYRYIKIDIYEGILTQLDGKPLHAAWCPLIYGHAGANVAKVLETRSVIC